MRSNRGFPTVVVALVLGMLGPSPTGADYLLLSVSPGGGSRPPDSLLRKIDSADGSTMEGSSVSITLAGAVVIGATGLARNPAPDPAATEDLYALLKVEGNSFRLLVTLDEFTGIATVVGNGLGETPKKFAGIAFASDGTLYAVTGDGGATPEELFILDTGDASSISVIQLGAGSDGETLAFNPDDGLLYHASGIGIPNHPEGEIFETIDPDTDPPVVTNVTLSGFDYEELTALTFLDGGFFAGDLGDAAFDTPGFFRITPGGVVTFLGEMDHVSKGLVHADPTPTPSATPTPSSTPTATPTPTPSSTPTVTPTATPTATPPTPTPTATPTPTPTTTPTATPTASPTPTPEPSVILQLVAGGVGLALLDKRRMRKKRRPSRTNQSSSRAVCFEVGEE